MRAPCTWGVSHGTTTCLYTIFPRLCRLRYSVSYTLHYTHVYFLERPSGSISNRRGHFRGFALGSAASVEERARVDGATVPG
eukprot:12074793-Prorocentrum_lima.AAC.1